jgi:hypothetical protein
MVSQRDFAAQIIDLVLSRLPDHLILEAVRRRLGGRVALVRAGARPAAEVSRRAPAPRPQRASSPERERLRTAVERIVRDGAGMSVSDVTKLARAPQTRVASVLKELKLAGRIFQGGDRRFARYAADPKLAAQASARARESAPGPILATKKAPRARRSK